MHHSAAKRTYDVPGAKMKKAADSGEPNSVAALQEIREAGPSDQTMTRFRTATYEASDVPG